MGTWLASIISTSLTYPHCGKRGSSASCARSALPPSMSGWMAKGSQTGWFDGLPSSAHRHCAHCGERLILSRDSIWHASMRGLKFHAGCHKLARRAA